MTELREIFDNDFDILLEKSQLPKYALGKLKYNFVKGDQKNLNHRIYGEDILVREITKKKLELENSKTIGQLDHPLDGHTKLQDSMHILGDISYDKSLKVGVAESYILDTRSGRDFLTLLETGISLGPSMRGWGNTDSRGQVLPDWKLETIDFVLKPSFGQDVVIDKTNLIESANSLFETEGKNKMGIKSKENQIQEKVEIKDVFMEARIAGIDPKVFAARINKEVDRQNQAILDGSEINMIFREAQSAGMNTADPEIRKKILENFEKQKNEPGKVLTEKQKAKIKDQEESSKYDYLVSEKMAAGYKGKKL